MNNKHNNSKKRVKLIISEKGGCGKSILTYIFALTQGNNDNVLFVDTDSSTQTSTKQISRIMGENRFETLSLLDDTNTLVRDNIISYFQIIAGSHFEEIYFDFGSPESEQFTYLITQDLPFFDFMDELNFETEIFVVVAGGGAYNACISYLQKIIKAVNGQCKITVWKNITSFHGFKDLAIELENNCRILGLELRQFGDFDPKSNLGNEILKGIRLGSSQNEYPLGARMKIMQELKTNFNYEQGK